MNYIIHTNSEGISKEFYRLSRSIPLPTGDDIYSLLEVFTHNDGRKAFGFDNSYPILIHHDWDGVDVDDLINAFGDLNNGQQNALNNKIQSIILPPQAQEPDSGHVLGRFPSNGIMNQLGQVQNQTQMEVDGWFL